MTILSEVRLAAAAGGRGETGARQLPLAAGTGELRYGVRWVGTGPRPATGLAVGYTLAAPALTAAEESLVRQILGDDGTEAGDDGVTIAWRLGPIFQDAAEAAAAYSPSWFVASDPAPDAEDDPTGVMRWVARRLQADRVSESVVLDGALPFVTLVLDDGDAPPIVESPLGRGVHALPAPAAWRLLDQVPDLAASGVVTVLTTAPRGAASRWRDRRGRMLYILPPDTRPRVVSRGRLAQPILGG